MESTNVAILKFEEKLDTEELQCFRGAIVNLVGKENVAFHNHLANGKVHYTYPLVQYKLIDGHVAITGIGGATAAVTNMASKFPCQLSIGKKSMNFHLYSCTLKPYTPIAETKPKLYTIKNYIALTDENFKKYHSILALTDKITYLENILIGNILSFFKGIGYHAEERIFCAITSLEGPNAKYYKGVKFDVFDISFVSNIELPSYISLGKSSSIGFGVLKQEVLPERFENYK